MHAEHQRRITDDVAIVLCGEAGQGIQTIEHVLTHVCKLAGYHVFATKEYMSRVRGGSNSTEIRIASRPVAAFVDRIDILVPLDKEAIGHVRGRITEETVILGEKQLFPEVERIIDVPFAEIAAEVGNTIYANTVAVGVICGLVGIDFKLLDRFLASQFAKKGEKIVAANREAAAKGYEMGQGLAESGPIRIAVETTPGVERHIFLNGAEAVGLGAVAGGCNFIGSYPMSPSTGVLVFLAGLAEEFGIVVEQVEDEIAAINMGIGAWYAGGRAMVTTSGGGFALMGEGMSLAGMTETPMVIHLAQRPGPATGLPTRTEQGDLELALHSGHGEFPRIILAPGTVQEAFLLARQAFYLADKYQVVVILLTDQYLIDSFCNVASLDMREPVKERYFIETDEEYLRYRLTADGISPRGIPGHGTGLVCVDSDEHDEAGHITEDLALRSRMVDKRLRKLEALMADAVAPELVGGREYEVLLVGWGSTYHVVCEALGKLGRKEISFLHCKQVYPIHPQVAEYLGRARHRVVIENNATSQFGRLLALYTGHESRSALLKYSGLPFSVEEISRKIEAIVSGES